MKKIICTIMCVLSLTSCMKYKTLSKIWDIKSENIYKVDCHFFIASYFSRYTKEEHIDVFFDFINVKYEDPIIACLLVNAIVDEMANQMIHIMQIN